MRAIVQQIYGPPEEVLHLAEAERPSPGPGEVLVQVAAAGLGPEVWHLSAGLPHVVRLGTGLRRPRQPLIGRDLAGRVAETGAGVTDFKVGDEVFGAGVGTFAEYARANVRLLAHRPPGLAPTDAAALPVSGSTALQAVRDRAGTAAGDHVAVLGAGGGVGTYAVQIAKSLGAEVTGVCGPDKTDLVRSLGADHVIDYTREEIPARRFDTIVDTAGHRPLKVLRRALTRHGTLVIVGSETSGRVLGGLGRTVGAAVTFPLRGLRAPFFFSMENRADLETLAGLVAEGAIAPVIGRTYPLGQVPEALRGWREGHSRGKTVITVEPPA